MSRRAQPTGLPEHVLKRQRLFRSVFFGSDAAHQAMYELAMAWHFFDPDLETEEARRKHQCFLELLIMSGMWPAGKTGTRQVFDAFRAFTAHLSCIPQETIGDPAP